MSLIVLARAQKSSADDCSAVAYLKLDANARKRNGWPAVGRQERLWGIKKIIIVFYYCLPLISLHYFTAEILR